jgi:hypothetical protein
MGSQSARLLCSPSFETPADAGSQDEDLFRSEIENAMGRPCDPAKDDNGFHPQTAERA